MTADTIDDLHAAEDEVGVLRGALEQLIAALDDDTGNGYGEQLDNARKVLSQGAGCRPTCRFDEEGSCQEDDPECCGCPCDHVMPDDDEDIERCSRCGANLADDEGEGYDGLCGSCADIAEHEGRWS